MLEREGGQAAQDEAEEEDREPETNGAEEFGFGLEGGRHVWAMVAHSDCGRVEAGLEWGRRCGEIS